MSIDLVVLPQTDAAASWAEVRVRFRRLVGARSVGARSVEARADALLGPEPALVGIRDQRRLDPDDPLALEVAYRVLLAVPNTLVVARLPNRGYATPDEAGWVDDWGRALPPARRRDIATRWRRVGFHYALTSMGGRGPREPELFTALAIAFGQTCDGLVVTMHGTAWNTGVGIHTPVEFAEVSPRF